MANETYVELKGVNKSFGDFKASKDISFGIQKGRLIGLLGPSGSGKATILRMLAGLETADSGDIIIDGKVVNDVPACQRGIGFVFQNYALFRYMTVWDNIAFGLQVQKWPKEKIRSRVEEMLELVFAGRAPGFAYTRIGNPTVAAFEQRINALEGGVGAVACSSGMAAVTVALLNVLRAGDELIAANGLFGGTLNLLRDLENFGIVTRYVDELTPEKIAPLVNEHTRAVFGEVISNPALQVLDIAALAAFVHGKNLPLFVDSTTATPYLANPLKLGADVVIHSSSKYINGSGDAVSGVIVDGGSFRWDAARYPGLAEYQKFGRFAYLSKLRNGLWQELGGCLAPMNAYLNVLGLETLGLRMERICSNAHALAAALSGLDGVTVNYPTLPDAQAYDLAQRQFGGKGGGILTLRAGSKERAYALINHLKYARIASNIGDVRTLVIHPASTIYLHSTPEAMHAAGVFEDTIRVSVGIEAAADLIADFTDAIKSL